MNLYAVSTSSSFLIYLYIFLSESVCEKKYFVSLPNYYIATYADFGIFLLGFGFLNMRVTIVVSLEQLTNECIVCETIPN